MNTSPSDPFYLVVHILGCAHESLSSDSRELHETAMALASAGFQCDVLDGLCRLLAVYRPGPDGVVWVEGAAIGA